MEPRNPAVERLINALSPSLSTEIDRLLSEARTALETEFEQRLRTEKTQLEAERQKAIDAMKKQVSDELQAQFSTTLAETTNNLKATQQAELQKLQGDLQKAQVELLKLQQDAQKTQQQAEQWRVLAEAQRQLNGAGSQTEILVRWLKLAEPFASSIAVYTAKADGLALWKNRGKAVFPNVISQQTTDPESYFKPIVVRDKTVAAVCAIQPYSAEALDFLSASMERAIELYGLKLRASAAMPGTKETARISS
jgi:DNA repair exonuclease SbcCD ATPase subunit